jgi:hypothetical protein
MAFDYDHPPHHSKSKLYVALELVTFGAVPLVSLNGRAETLQARCVICSSRSSARSSISSAGRCSTELWDPRYRLALPQDTRGARDPRRGRADDDGTPRQDRAFPSTSVAAARPCGRTVTR